MSTATSARQQAPVGQVRAGIARRAVVTTVVLSLLLAAVVTTAVATGAYPLSPDRLILTLLGQGEAREAFVLFRLRLPSIVLGLLVGAAFGIAGALFQTLLRNPLASPDIIGISGGASVASAFGILILGVSGAILSLLSFAGAIVVAAAIALLSARGGISGYRFVLIGVGFAFVAQAAIGYLTTRGDVREASQALVWIVGGLGGAEWEDNLVVALALAALFTLTAVVAPRLRMLQLGDDTAASLGIRVERTRLTILVVAVALTAVATAYAGPVAFVAFVSAPIARRIVGGGRLSLIPSALVGAIVVLVADLVGGNLLPGAAVPAGIVTGIIGAPYLLWLLATADRGRQTP
ncbi:iron ABC transporter permease [Salinibacterium sp. SYSU T00001]|uniref:FecCD family ABC transporter permease n=1 Tax=Homoserinimonas sedimenticola TaxID=2986805 RepID=UPI00223599ED|nr:iron ABC transporter permease [Salinibacterium sedimenticola]MCW4384892.1 iron ABC transporter permease [Salinibacterium sedimenticola]